MRLRFAVALGMQTYIWRPTCKSIKVCSILISGSSYDVWESLNSRGGEGRKEEVTNIPVIDQDTNDAEGTQAPSGPCQDVSTCQPMSPESQCTNLTAYSISSAMFYFFLSALRMKCVNGRTMWRLCLSACFVSEPTPQILKKLSNS
jgi:hypothetical protein